jgi:hypothetical protein
VDVQANGRDPFHDPCPCPCPYRDPGLGEAGTGNSLGWGWGAVPDPGRGWDLDSGPGPGAGGRGRDSGGDDASDRRREPVPDPEGGGVHNFERGDCRGRVPGPGRVPEEADEIPGDVPGARLGDADRREVREALGAWAVGGRVEAGARRPGRRELAAVWIGPGFRCRVEAGAGAGRDGLQAGAGVGARGLRGVVDPGAPHLREQADVGWPGCVRIRRQAPGHSWLETRRNRGTAAFRGGRRVGLWGQARVWIRRLGPRELRRRRPQLPVRRELPVPELGQQQRQQQQRQRRLRWLSFWRGPWGVRELRWRELPLQQRWGTPPREARPSWVLAWNENAI